MRYAILGLVLLAGCEKRGYWVEPRTGTRCFMATTWYCGMSLRHCENGREYKCVEEVEFVPAAAPGKEGGE